MEALGVEPSLTEVTFIYATGLLIPGEKATKVTPPNFHVVALQTAQQPGLSRISSALTAGSSARKPASPPDFQYAGEPATQVLPSQQCWQGPFGFQTK